jgi:hypothetical protein
MELDVSRWSGEGDFTQVLLEVLKGMGEIRYVRVEDAPASRADAGYSFISNEVYIAFHARRRREPVRRLGFLPGTRTVADGAQTLAGLETALAAIEAVGPSDYADEGMFQYLRAQRIVPPYQTKGYKLVELIRVYEAEPAPGPAY